MVTEILLAYSDLANTVLELAETLKEWVYLFPRVLSGTIALWAVFAFSIYFWFSKASLVGTLTAIALSIINLGIQNGVLDCNGIWVILIFFCFINGILFLITLSNLGTLSVTSIITDGFIRDMFTYIFFYSLTYSILYESFQYSGPMSFRDYFSWEAIIFSFCPLCG